MRDYGLLLKLKTRHLRTAFSFIVGGIIGSDFQDDNSLSERLYQVYCLIFIGICVSLLWTALLRQTSEVFIALGASLTVTIFHMALFFFPLVFILTAVSCLRSCPITLSSPDISYVAASPIKPFSLIFCSMTTQVIGAGLIGFFTGYLFSVGLHNGLGLAIPVFGCAVLFMMFALVSFLGGWVLGVFRLCGNKSRSFSLIIVSVMLMLTAVITPLLLISGGHIGDGVAIQTAIVGGYPLLSVVTFLVVVIEFFLLRTISSRVSMTQVIDENALYSDMYSLRYMPLYDMSGYRDLRRRKQLAAQRLRFRLVFGSGQVALVSRSALSYLRQFKGALSLLLWGVILAPTAVYLLFSSFDPDGPVSLVGPVSPAMWLLWAMVVIAFPAGAREMTRTFREDTQNKMIRHSLPFSTLRILICNAALPFAVVSLVSFTAIVIAQFTNPLLPWCLPVSLLINAAFLLCASLEGLFLSKSRRPLGYEIAAIITVLALFLTSFTGSPVLVLLVLCACIFALASVLRACEG